MDPCKVPITFINACIEEWHNLGPNANIRSLEKDDVVASPFEVGPKAALRNILPSGDSPSKIKIDIAHTYAIGGFGKDDLASAIVFLSCHCNLFSGSTIEQKLDAAFMTFMSFKNWCINKKKTTSITEFDYQTLKITSFL